VRRRSIERGLPVAVVENYISAVCSAHGREADMPGSPPDQRRAENLTLCLDVRWAAQGAALNAVVLD